MDGSGLLEVTRRTLEEVDRLEEHIVEALLRNESTTQRDRLMGEMKVAALIEAIRRSSALLVGSLTASAAAAVGGDASSSGAAAAAAAAAWGEAVDAITAGADGFGNFYTHLKETKDAHRRLQALDGAPVANVDDVDFDAIVKSCLPSEASFDAAFSGEEAQGRFLDMHRLHGAYVNLPGVQPLDYVAYLGAFDDFARIPRAARCGGASSRAYEAYLGDVVEYLESFLRRSRPLFDLQGALDAARNMARDEVHDGMQEGAHEGVHDAVHDAAHASAVGKGNAGVEEGSIGKQERLHCAACARAFTNEAVYRGHLGGKKHLRALAAQQPGGGQEAPPARLPDQRAAPSKQERIAQKEALVACMAGLLGRVREETRTNVERKQSRTVEEREADALLLEQARPALPAGATDDAEDGDGAEEAEGEEKIYNPLNIPLDWDGKPIPYWLWKLHGLGVRFECEICGDAEYMGRRAFDQHFSEWRHSSGMKALAIPNTRHFFQITRIDEARALWEKLRAATRSEAFRADAMEEFEDAQGNVYSRKTYEDLRRQGLI